MWGAGVPPIFAHEGFSLVLVKFNILRQDYVVVFLHTAGQVVRELEGRRGCIPASVSFSYLLTIAWKTT